MNTITRRTLDKKIADGTMDIIEWMTKDHARIRVEQKNKMRVREYYVKERR